MADRELDLRLIIRADGSLAVRNLNQVDEALDRVGDSAQDAGGDMRDLGNQANQTGGIMSRLTGIVRSFGPALTAAIPAAVVAATALLARNLINVNQEMDDLRDRLDDVTGSSEAASQKFAQLQTLAEDSEFTVGDLTDAYADLHNHGLIPTGEVMLALTNSSAKLEDSSKKLNDITGILGKSWAESRLSADALLKLIDLGIPALDLMQKATGKNSAQLLDMARKGQLGREAISQLIAEMGKFASGENERSLETIRGRFDQLSETWSRFIDNLGGEKTEGAIKTVSGWIQSMIRTFTDAVNFLDIRINGPTNLSQINQEIERLQGNIARFESNPGQLNIRTRRALADYQTELKALEQRRDAIMAAEEAERKAFENSKTRTAPAKSVQKTGRDSSLDDARQIAAAELQIQLDKIARIEQIANAEFANDLARAEAHAAEKLAQAKGGQAAELAIEQELADAKAAIERNQLEASRSFAEQRLTTTLNARRAELALTSDRGEQAKIQADIIKLEEQIQIARELSGLAAQKLATDETAAAAQRAQAQQNLVDQVIAKYDLLAARMKEFDADAAIISNSNLSENRKAEILALIAQRYGEAGQAADETGDTMSDFAEQAARNMQDAFADFLFDPFQDGLKGMLRGFIDTIRRITAEALSAQIFDALLGAKNKNGDRSGGFLTDLLGIGGSLDEVAQVTSSEAAKTAAVTAGEAARTTAVTSAAAAKTAVTASSQGAQTTAVVAGETARQAAETAGQGKSLLTVITTAGKKIHAFAASAAAGAYDAMASIEYVGPILGGVAAAVTYAAVLAFGALTGGAAFAAGGRVDGTSGGRMRGPGTGTSDEIPAWLSNNEQVIKEDSVRKLDAKYGSGFLDFLNQYGEIPRGAKALAIPAMKIPTVKFNAGGRVNASPVNNTVRVDPAQVDARTKINIVNVTDPALVHDAMANSAGVRTLLNVVTNNPRAFKQAMEL